MRNLDREEASDVLFKFEGHKYFPKNDQGKLRALLDALCEIAVDRAHAERIWETLRWNKEFPSVGEILNVGVETREVPEVRPFDEPACPQCQDMGLYYVRDNAVARCPCRSAVVGVVGGRNS